jgi:hypothetical protein
MNNQLQHKLQRRIKLYIWVVIVGLFLSGVTAFPIETELAILINHPPIQSHAIITAWLNKVYQGY